MSNLQKVLDSLEALPKEDLDSVAEGMASHFMTGLKLRDKSGLLSGRDPEQGYLKEGFVQTFSADLLERIERAVSQDFGAVDRINGLVDPYTLAVITEQTPGNGFAASLLLASEPREMDFAAARMRRATALDDISPFLPNLRLNGRTLREPNLQLWSDRTSRASDGVTFANVTNSTTGEVNERDVNNKADYVSSVRLPLVVIRGFLAQKMPIGYRANTK